MAWYGKLAVVFMLAAFALAYWSAVVARNAESRDAWPRASMTRAAPALGAMGETSRHAR